MGIEIRQLHGGLFNSLNLLRRIYLPPYIGRIRPLLDLYIDTILGPNLVHQ
jgi:hypothetical protein